MYLNVHMLMALYDIQEQLFEFSFFTDDKTNSQRGLVETLRAKSV